MGFFTKLKKTVTNLNVFAKDERGKKARQIVGRGAVAGIAGYFTGGASLFAAAGAGLWAGQDRGALTGKEALEAAGKGVITGVGTSLIKSGYAVGKGGNATPIIKILGNGVKEIAGFGKTVAGLVTTTISGLGIMAGLKKRVLPAANNDIPVLSTPVTDISIPSGSNTSDNVTSSYWTNPLGGLFRTPLFGAGRADRNDGTNPSDLNINPKDLITNGINWRNWGLISAVTVAGIIIFLFLKRR
jgi:hypothetical protein